MFYDPACKRGVLGFLDRLGMQLLMGYGQFATSTTRRVFLGKGSRRAALQARQDYIPIDKYQRNVLPGDLEIV